MGPPAAAPTASGRGLLRLGSRELIGRDFAVGGSKRGLGDLAGLHAQRLIPQFRRGRAVLRLRDELVLPGREVAEFVSLAQPERAREVDALRAVVVARQGHTNLDQPLVGIDAGPFELARDIALVGSLGARAT